MSEPTSLLLPILLGLVLVAVGACLWLLLRKPALAPVDTGELAALRERLVAREEEIARFRARHPLGTDVQVVNAMVGATAAAADAASASTGQTR